RVGEAVGEEVRAATPAAENGRKEPTDAADAPLTLFERLALWQQIRFRLGTARLVQAKLSPDESADRAAALVAADEWLLPLAAGTSGDRLTSESQLVLAEVTRLRRDFDRAAKMLATFEKALSLDTPADLRERFVIERVRWWLAKGQPADAASFLVDQRKSGVLNTSVGQAGTPTATVPSSELAYWQVAVELALWRVCTD